MKIYIFVIGCIFIFSSCLNRSEYEKECRTKTNELEKELSFLDSINSRQHHEIDSLENRLDSLSNRLEWMKTHKFKYKRIDDDILVRWVKNGDVQDLEDFVDEIDFDINIEEDINIPLVSGTNRNEIIID